MRVTAHDVIALKGLRQDEQLGRLAAETNREARKNHHFAELEAGALAAVTRGGDVHRINADKLGRIEIGRSSERVSGARGVQAEREQTSTVWGERQRLTPPKEKRRGTA